MKCRKKEAALTDFFIIFFTLLGVEIQNSTIKQISSCVSH